MCSDCLVRRTMSDSNSDTAARCVLLVVGSRELAASIRHILTTRGFSVVMATSCAQAHRLIEREDLCFHAAVLDHQLPDGDALELVAALDERNPSCRSLVLTAHDDDDDVVRKYQLRGAFRCVSKPLEVTKLAVLVSDPIHHTYRWRRQQGQADSAVPPPVVIPDFDHAAIRLRHSTGLSPTEQIVARWMLEGLSNAEIAQRLGRAERTAERHVNQVLAKVKVKKRG